MQRLTVILIGRRAYGDAEVRVLPGFGPGTLIVSGLSPRMSKPGIRLKPVTLLQAGLDIRRWSELRLGTCHGPPHCWCGQTLRCAAWPDRAMRLKALADDVFDDCDARSTVSTDIQRLPDDCDVARTAQQPFAGLYCAERPRLLRFFARRVGPEEAHDLLQEAFTSFIAAVSGQPRRIEKPEAYLNTIASNLVTKRGRTAARRSTALHVSTDDLSLTGLDPETHLEARDVLDRLEKAMARLRPMTREIFMAHRLDGYTYREIAERTGLSLKRVEKHMSRAIAQLDDILSAGR